MEPNIVYINKPYEILNKSTAKSDTGIQRLLHKCFDSDADNLVKSLAEVATDGFGKPRPEEDVRNHVLQVDRLYLAFDGAHDKLIAFSSYDYLDMHGCKTLYLCGTVVRKEYQNQGMFDLVNRMELANCPFGPDYFVGRTQNPVIYSAMSRLVKSAYPSAVPIPEDVKKIGVAIAKEKLHMDDFDPETFVGRGTYGESLYDEVPYCKARPFFDNTLKINYKRGDSVLVVGVVR